MSKEEQLEKLLAKLKAQPLAEERQEFGKMLFRHIDDFTPEDEKDTKNLKKY